MCRPSRPFFSDKMTEDFGNQYRTDGYAVCRNVFNADEMALVKAATERVRAKANSGEGACGNAKFFVENGNVRSATWCALHDPVLADVRNDERILSIVRPLVGDTVRQLINNLHWKPPESDFSVAFHTDRLNRERGQGDRIRNLPDSYVQTGLAVDPMMAENGPLILIRGSHRTTERLPPPTVVYSDGGFDRDALVAAGYAASDIVELNLQPGDMAVWGPDTLHGSGVNRHPTSDRCFYVNGYANAYDCFPGYWAWIDGKPVSLPDKRVPVHVYGDQGFETFSDE